MTRKSKHYHRWQVLSEFANVEGAGVWRWSQCACGVRKVEQVVEGTAVGKKRYLREKVDGDAISKRAAAAVPVRQAP